MFAQSTSTDVNGPLRPFVTTAAKGRFEPILPFAAMPYFCTKGGFRPFAAIVNLLAHTQEADFQQGMDLPYTFSDQELAWIQVFSGLIAFLALLFSVLAVYFTARTYWQNKGAFVRGIRSGQLAGLAHQLDRGLRRIRKWF